MKQFNTLREETLEEKLKASDPAGTYIHDFVHSDNPKFAGKSKKKRIQMALAASYAAKGKSKNEEVEQQEEGVMDAVKTMAKKLTKYQDKSIVKPNITAVRDNTQVKTAGLPIKVKIEQPKRPRMRKVIKKAPIKI